ncbi:MAG: mevalonate kinase [Chloroflexaceae bacterium]|nr:mevalonate kinase [Chloroflexaceae bacterium]
MSKPPSSASAPAKLILCGEHAVVYGRPAIALPLAGVRANVQVDQGRPGSGITLRATNLHQEWKVDGASPDPLGELALATLHHLGIPPSDLVIMIDSAIPIAGGMGSGAAVATALVRALAAHIGCVLPAGEISALVYTCEQRYHGTPSGIDNTVIAHERPIWFERRMGSGQRRTVNHIEPVAIANPLTLVIGDTGVRSETRLPVGEVRQRWQADPTTYEALFDQVGSLVRQAREALAMGDHESLGPLLNENQRLLETMGVSSPELARLVQAARDAGASGAKLSGAGWGGVMLALADDDDITRRAIVGALKRAGAVQVLETQIESSVLV